MGTDVKEHSEAFMKIPLQMWMLILGHNLQFAKENVCNAQK